MYVEFMCRTNQQDLLALSKTMPIPCGYNDPHGTYGLAQAMAFMEQTRLVAKHKADTAKAEASYQEPPPIPDNPGMFTAPGDDQSKVANTCKDLYTGRISVESMLKHVYKAYSGGKPQHANLLLGCLISFLSTQELVMRQDKDTSP